MEQKNQGKDAPEEKTFDQLYEESLSLLKGVLDTIDKQPTNPDVPMDAILKRLEQMEIEFNTFVEANKDVFDVMNTQAESAEAQIPKSLLNRLKRSKELKARAEKKMEEIVETQNAMKNAGVEEKKVAPKPSKKEAARKNKFRRIGGNRDWKPL